MADRRVIFVMSSSPDKDIRVCKEAAALKKKGYATRLLYWDRDGIVSPGNTEEYDELSRFGLKAPSGSGLLPLLPLWWAFVLFKLVFSRWDVVHALNFHAIFPAWLAARLRGKSVVYEIIDFYEWRLPVFIRGFSLWLDKFFMRLSDAVIIADAAQQEMVGGIPNPETVVLYDSPPGAFLDEAAPAPPSDDAPLTLFYTGALYRNRRLNLDKVAAALREIEGVRLVIGGYGDLEEEIEGWAKELPGRVDFIGRISYADVIRRGRNADLFFVLRDATVPTNRYTCGSNLFNAMICGKPLLANRGSSTATKVAEAEAGIVVDGEDIGQIREALVRLREDRALCRRLGGNARRAYEELYSWEVMVVRLADLYDRLAGEATGKER